MFNEQTTFILGAGASKPYDFPLGEGLVTEIINNIEKDKIFIPEHPQPYSNNDNDAVLHRYYELEQIRKPFSLIEIGKETEFSQIPPPRGIGGIQYEHTESKTIFFQSPIRAIEKFNELPEALRNSDAASIDIFLRDNPKYMQAAKIMMIYCLLKAEDKTKFTNKTKDNWYTKLLNHITLGCSNSPQNIINNQLNIITFNYDVSLECFLHVKLNGKESFSGKNAGAAAQFLDGLNIRHVYGAMHEIDKLASDYGDYSQYDGKRELVSQHNLRRFVTIQPKRK